MPFGIPSQNRERVRQSILGLVDKINKAEAIAAQRGYESAIDRQVQGVMRSFSEMLTPAEKAQGKIAKPSPEEIFGATQTAISQLSTLGVKGQAAAKQLMEGVGLYTKLFPTQKRELEVAAGNFVWDEASGTYKQVGEAKSKAARPTKEVEYGGVVKKGGRDFQPTRFIYTDTGEVVPNSEGFKALTWPPGSGQGDENLADSDIFDYQEQEIEGQKVQVPTAVKENLDLSPKTREARKDKYEQLLRQTESQELSIENNIAGGVVEFDPEARQTKIAEAKKTDSRLKEVRARKAVFQKHLDVLRKAHAGSSPKTPDYLKRARGKGRQGFMEK